MRGLPSHLTGAVTAHPAADTILQARPAADIGRRLPQAVATRQAVCPLPAAVDIHTAACLLPAAAADIHTAACLLPAAAAADTTGRRLPPAVVIGLQAARPAAGINRHPPVRGGCSKI
jgi:hypothetical protein